MPMKPEQVKRGTVCIHHSGRVYTIFDVTNTGSDKPSKFPVEVYYVGANGKPWSRKIDEFCRSFTVLFDGTQNGIIGGFAVVTERPDGEHYLTKTNQGVTWTKDVLSALMFLRESDARKFVDTHLTGLWQVKRVMDIIGNK